jgi:hypothetical protein
MTKSIGLLAGSAFAGAVWAIAGSASAVTIMPTGPTPLTFLSGGDYVFSFSELLPSAKPYEFTFEIVPFGISTQEVTSASAEISENYAGYPGDLAYSLTSAIPEPATWAAMLLGFGALGVSMRSARRQAVLNAA